MRGAAIAGASGLTGQHVLNRLLDHGGFDPVVALLRKPLHRNHPRLLEKVVDFDRLAAFPAQSVDAAFCTLGTTIRKAGSKDGFRAVDQIYTLNFARWAKASGARHFLYLSSVGARADSSYFYLQVKGETERELEQIGFEHLDIFQPSFLFGARSEQRSFEKLGQAVVQGLTFALAGPLERYRGIAASTVAAAMVERAKNPGDGGVTRHEWREIMALGG